MACLELFTPPVLIVRWQERCEAGDVVQIKAWTEAAYAKHPEGLIYMAIIPLDCAPPDGDARAALRAGTEHASKHCKTVHVVIEGQGLRRALIRSISAGLLLATRKTSKGFHINETVEEALLSAGLDDETRARVLDEASRANMLS